MNRILIAAVVLLVVLSVTDRTMEHRRQSLLTLSSSFRSLVDPPRVTGDDVHRIDVGTGLQMARWQYVREDGLWRYPGHHNAMVQEDRIDRLLKGVLEAKGTVVASTPSQSVHLGVGQEQALRLTLRDAGGGVLQEVMVGTPVPGRGNDEAYARLAASDTTLHLHANPRLAIGEPATAGVPMVDPHVLPKALARKAVTEITFQHAAGYPVRSMVRVQLEQKEGTRPGLPEGPTVEWRYATGSGEGVCNTSRGFGYVSFLSRLRYAALHDPEQGGRYGFGGQAVHLIDEEGIVDTLDVGGVDAAGNTYVRNRSAWQVCTVTPPKARLLFPPESTLTDTTRGESPFNQAEPLAPFGF